MAHGRSEHRAAGRRHAAGRACGRYVDPIRTISKGSMMTAGRFKQWGRGLSRLSLGIAAMALPVLSHRVVLNFQAEAEGVSTTSLIAPLTKG